MGVGGAAQEPAQGARAWAWAKARAGEEVSPPRAAVVQMTSTTDVERNLAIAERLVEEAADEGATFVLSLPVETQAAVPD